MLPRPNTKKPTDVRGERERQSLFSILEYPLPIASQKLSTCTLIRADVNTDMRRLFYFISVFICFPICVNLRNENEKPKSSPSSGEPLAYILRGFTFYFTASFKTLPARNFGFFEAAI